MHARVLLRMCASLCRSSRTRLQHSLEKVLLECSARYQPLAASPVCAFYAARTALLVAHEEPVEAVAARARPHFTAAARSCAGEQNEAAVAVVSGDRRRCAVE